ncbi:MAG: hypothetical protein ABW034_11990 [Steroidobacteraceae bacterium]
MMAAHASTLVIAASTLATSTVFAIDVQRADTRYHNGRYELEVEATLHAPAPEVQRVLRDYVLYPKLDSRVLDAKVLERPKEHEALLYSQLRVCIAAILCRRVNRVERVEERTNELLATAIPERSDVKFGLTHMQLSTTAESTTRLVYRTQIEPKFWVPRMLPKRAMLNTLRDATIQLLTQVEKNAQHGTVHAEVPHLSPAVPVK